MQDSVLYVLNQVQPMASLQANSSHQPAPHTRVSMGTSCIESPKPAQCAACTSPCLFTAHTWTHPAGHIFDTPVLDK